MGPLHRAATLTWHAVTSPGVGKPQALQENTQTEGDGAHCFALIELFINVILKWNH